MKQKVEQLENRLRNIEGVDDELDKQEEKMSMLNIKLSKNI